VVGNPLAVFSRADGAYDLHLWIYDGNVRMEQRQLMHIIRMMEPKGSVDQTVKRMADLGCCVSNDADIEFDYRLASPKCIATDCMIIRSSGYYAGDSPRMPVEAYLCPLSHQLELARFPRVQSHARVFHIQMEAAFELHSRGGIDRRTWLRRYLRRLDAAVAKRRLNLATAAAALQVYLGIANAKLIRARDWKDIEEDVEMGLDGGIRLLTSSN